MKSNIAARYHAAAKRRGLRAKISGENVAFYEGERRVWRGPAANAREFFDGFDLKPVRSLHPLGVTLKDYAEAKRYGDYEMKIADGVIRLWAGDAVVLETKDVARVRRFIQAAREGLVPRGPAALERERQARERLAEQLRRSAERERRAAEREKVRREIAARRRSRGHLRPDERGVPSEDFTPENYRGLELTFVMLPRGFDAEACLLSLWALENKNPYRPAPSITETLAAAKAMSQTETREVWLSDHDRASLERYGADTSVVLAAAMLARRNLARGDSHAMAIRV